MHNANHVETEHPWTRQFDCSLCGVNLTFSFNEVPEVVLNYRSSEFVTILNFEKICSVFASFLRSHDDCFN